MARQKLTRSLATMVSFEGVGLSMPRRKRRQGGGRRHRLRRFAGERSRTEEWVLRDVTVQIDPGESVALLGLKNSGRIEFLRLATGTLLPDEGKVSRREPVIPLIGNGRALDRSFTIRQNIYVLGGLLGMTPGDVERKLPGIVESAEVTANIDRYLGSASPLARQKLAWSIAMATEGHVIAADDTLIVGDAEFKEQCWAHVREMKAQGVTFMVSTDVPRLYEDFCDRALVVHEGRILADTDMASGIGIVRELRSGNQSAQPTDGDLEEEDQDSEG